MVTVVARSRPPAQARPAITEATARVGGCPTGEARATTAGELDARHVVHAVGPVWHGGDQGEDAALEACHRAAITLAGQLGCRSVALPAISTGIYGFPLARAAGIAVHAALEAAVAGGVVREVRFVLFRPEDLAAFAAALGAEAGRA